MSHCISFTSSAAQARGQRWGQQKPPWAGTGEQQGHTRGSHPTGDTQRGGAACTEGRAGCPCSRGSPRGSQEALPARPGLSGAAGAEASSGHSHVVPPGAPHVVGRQCPGHGEVTLEEVTGLGNSLGSASGGGMVWAGPCRGSSALGAELRSVQSSQCLWRPHRCQPSVNPQSFPTWRLLQGFWNVWSV